MRALLACVLLLLAGCASPTPSSNAYTPDETDGDCSTKYGDKAIELFCYGSGSITGVAENCQGAKEAILVVAIIPYAKGSASVKVVAGSETLLEKSYSAQGSDKSTQDPHTFPAKGSYTVTITTQGGEMSLGANLNCQFR